MNKVMRIIKEKRLNIINQKLELDCQITISIRKNDAMDIFYLLDELYEINITKID